MCKATWENTYSDDMKCKKLHSTMPLWKPYPMDYEVPHFKLFDGGKVVGIFSRVCEEKSRLGRRVLSQVG